MNRDGSLLATGSAESVQVGAEDVVTVPPRIVFNDPLSARRRPALIHIASRKGELVPLPKDADPVSCRQLSSAGAVDLHHDGVPDVAFVVYTPSNRYPVIVSEGRIYLSDLAHGTYCYAPGSRRLGPRDVPR